MTLANTVLFAVCFNALFFVGFLAGLFVARVAQRDAEATLPALDDVGPHLVASSERPTNPHAALIDAAPAFSPETVRRGVLSLESQYRDAGLPVPSVARLEREAMQVLNHEEVG